MLFLRLYDDNIQPRTKKWLCSKPFVFHFKIVFYKRLNRDLKKIYSRHTTKTIHMLGDMTQLNQHTRLNLYRLNSHKCTVACLNLGQGSFTNVCPILFRIKLYKIFF